MSVIFPVAAEWKTPPPWVLAVLLVKFTFWKEACTPFSAGRQLAT